MSRTPPLDRCARGEQVIEFFATPLNPAAVITAAYRIIAGPLLAFTGVVLYARDPLMLLLVPMGLGILWWGCNSLKSTRDYYYLRFGLERGSVNLRDFYDLTKGGPDRIGKVILGDTCSLGQKIRVEWSNRITDPTEIICDNHEIVRLFCDKLHEFGVPVEGELKA